MKKLLVMDEKNYDTSLEEIQRIAVRAIIFINDRLVLIKSAFGEIKLPGGGKEAGESDIDTLIREVKEETGYHVIPSSIRAFGEVEEKRLSTKENKIWHQLNRYYFCDISLHDKENPQFTANEQSRGFQQVYYSIDDAIRINRDMQESEGIKAWNKRELTVFYMIKEAMQGEYAEDYLKALPREV